MLLEIRPLLPLAGNYPQDTNHSRMTEALSAQLAAVDVAAGGSGPATATEEEALYAEHEVPEGAMDDLAGLANLNEDTLLHEVQVRYTADNIYT